jgi:hypothetical protein
VKAGLRFRPLSRMEGETRGERTASMTLFVFLELNMHELVRIIISYCYY